MNIWMDEEEMSIPLCDDETLAIVLEMLGPKCKDLLLIPRTDDA